jgi:hypothetical protein
MMGNPKASSVAPLTPVPSPGSIDFGPEPAAEVARNFHFAVTWVTLFAHLDPIESTGPRPQPANPVPSLALVPVVAAPLLEQRAERDSKPRFENAAWEMVVPKMVRNESGGFSAAETKQPKLL